MTSDRDSAPFADDLESKPTKGTPAWAGIAVRLLQGAVYHEEDSAGWEMLLRHRDRLAEYLGTLALQLIIDEGDGMAYLRPAGDASHPDESVSIPRLFRRQPLTYDATLLCVLLREELLRFEEHELLSDRCIVQQHALFDVWRTFFPPDRDEVKLHRALSAALRKLEDLKLVKLFEREPPSWEIRRILKARLHIEELERLKTALASAAALNHGSPSPPVSEPSS
ncbi:MAG: DUF4194 domain-containing protein [Pirellula sp.]